MTLRGCCLPVATFGAAEASAFKSTVATAVGVPASAITITSLTAAARRYLLTAGVSVAFSVLASSSSVTAASVTTAVAAVTTTTLQSGGLTACSGVAVVGTVGTSTATTAPVDVFDAPASAAPHAATAVSVTALLAATASVLVAACA
jgi:hypothetical protein